MFTLTTSMFWTQLLGFYLYIPNCPPLKNPAWLGSCHTNYCKNPPKSRLMLYQCIYHIRFEWQKFTSCSVDTSLISALNITKLVLYERSRGTDTPMFVLSTYFFFFYFLLSALSKEVGSYSTFGVQRVSS